MEQIRSVCGIYFDVPTGMLKAGGGIQDERSECLSPRPGRNTRSKATMWLWPTPSSHPKI